MTAARPAFPVLRPRSRPADHDAGGRRVEPLRRRPPVTPDRATAFDRERHPADYSILVAVAALAAIGILMVYSSSAMKALLQRDDSMAIVGPQILWAGVGLLVMLAVMRIDYRVLRLVSVPGYLLAVGLLLLVFVPQFNRVVGGSARWLAIGPLPAVHPAEFAKLAMVVFLAHWLATKGTGIRSFWRGTVPYLTLAGVVAGLVFKEPDLGTTVVISGTAMAMLFTAGARLWHFGLLGAGAAVGVLAAGLHDYQMERVQSWLNPWADPLGSGFHTIQGFLALGLGGITGAGLGESRLAGGLFLPNAFNDYIFAIIGEEFGLVGASMVIALFVVLGYAGLRTSMRAPDTFGALLAAGITAWLCLQAFINIAVVVGLVPVTGITLPFISAGGSSLTISFAAVGVLLSISRETVEGGAWNDAPADRGRGNGRSHLPGPRRRPVTPRPTRRR